VYCKPFKGIHRDLCFLNLLCPYKYWYTHLKIFVFL
jgi:hypothetical protein